MEKKYATRLQHTRELGDHARVVGGIVKESERCEEIDYTVEPTGPS